PNNEINLNVIDTYQKEFHDFLIGFSDHSLGILASIGAVAKGVKFIEKHFTLNKNMDGPDHKASLEPEELKEWVINIRKIEKMLGSYDKFPSDTEKETSKIARRSVVSLRNLKKGDIIREENITTKRPGTGIPPNQFYNIIGKKVSRDISENSIIKWDDIE
ncbi:MAG: N-acetylneuraminate synthase family protein, partial [Promethearchaeota archaeon]